MQGLIRYKIHFHCSFYIEIWVLRYLVMQIRVGVSQNSKITMFNSWVFSLMRHHLSGRLPKLKILSKMVSQVCLDMFLLENGAQHSPLSFVLGRPSGRKSNSTQMYFWHSCRGLFATKQFSSNVFALKIKFFDVWWCRIVNAIPKMINFRSPISGYRGSAGAAFWTWHKSWKIIRKLFFRYVLKCF